MIKELELAVSPAQAKNWDYVQALALETIGKSLSSRCKAVVLRRRTIDARPKVPVIRLWLELYIDEMPTETPKVIETIAANLASIQEVQKTAIIVGAGPAGYFAALELLELGIKPIILERGKDAQARRKDLRAIQQFGIVNEHSNYCFGEGGAGTYSDGKLYTRSNKRGSVTKILQIFVEHGAKSDILIDAHPHIGSNKLPHIMENMRATILKFGGEIHFDTFVTDLIVTESNAGERKIIGVVANDKDYRADAVVLATGHSARDIYKLLHAKNILVEAKPFALGVRIEHPQMLIDKIQYHQSPRDPDLPASSYSIVCQVQERGVFSFCMCPGGLIVPAATAPKELVVNGMSLSRRDSEFANSGLVVAVELEDMTHNPYDKKAKRVDPKKDPLIGLQFQQAIEQNFFQAGDGTQQAAAQRVPDFVKGKLSSSLRETSYIPGIFSSRVDQLLPDFITKRLQQGLQVFGKQKQGYFTEEAQLIGVESRTSSPVRIPRNNDTLMHPEVSGLFPCAEGAGYAGGIVSAGIDGQRVAIAIKNFLA